jgi:protein involved in polysaccharide export with SLBB domain
MTETGGSPCALRRRSAKTRNEMMIRHDALRLAGAILMTLAVSSWGQGGGGQERSVATSAMGLVEEESAKVVATLIGLEAYREVLASGTYVLGPGDEFLLYITGMDEPDISPVMAEGGLFVPGVGAVHVGGLSLETARLRIKTAFSEAFQQGAITVQLTKLRSFPVAVVGVVGSPGVVVSSGVERVSEVIRKAGDLGSTASRRNIRVIRTGQLGADAWARLRASADSNDYLGGLKAVSRRVDLELFNVTGDPRYNPFVEDGDRIVIPPRSGEVAIRGAVNREGFFEFVEGDHISDLLALAQGPVSDYDPAGVTLFRAVVGKTTEETISVDLPGVIAGETTADLLLRPEDWLALRALPVVEKSSTVRIIGEVVYPGYYVVEKDRTRLTEVISTAGGFSADASLWKAHIIRADDLQNLRSAEERGYLQTRDPEFIRIATIPVSDRTEEEDQYFIMKSRERPGKMVVDFVALFEHGDESQNIALLPGDLIVVPRSLQTVMVSGQAAYPGALTYRAEFTVEDYIEQAGGLGWRASTDIRVIKSRTGEMIRAADTVRIDPGDRIWIKEKPQRDYWAIFRDTMTIMGQLSATVLVYTTLTK